MIRLFTFFVLIIFAAVSSYSYLNSQRTFEAKFKNIDGLPKKASVTALGVKIGEVVRTKPVHDGIIVTVRITNKSFPRPEPGSQLTITSFRPNQGRVLEIIPPKMEIEETKAWIVQEPITTESWLHASLELLEGLKYFSEVAIKYVTKENFDLARGAFTEASSSLNQVVGKLKEHEVNLALVKEKFSSKTDEANALLLRLQKPINSLNKIINDKQLTTNFKSELNKFSDDLMSISENITSETFTTNLTYFKTMILDYLNNVNNSLIVLDQMVRDPVLKQKFMDFNEHLASLNALYDELSKQDISKLKVAARKAKDVTTSLAEKTSKQN